MQHHAYVSQCTIYSLRLHSCGVISDSRLGVRRLSSLCDPPGVTLCLSLVSLGGPRQSPVLPFAECGSSSLLGRVWPVCVMSFTSAHHSLPGWLFVVVFFVPSETIETVGAFSHSAGTAPIVTLSIPGTPLRTTPLQKRARSIQNRIGGADFRALGPMATGGEKQPTFRTLCARCAPSTLPSPGTYPPSSQRGGTRLWVRSVMQHVPSPRAPPAFRGSSLLVGWQRLLGLAAQGPLSQRQARSPSTSDFSRYGSMWYTTVPGTRARPAPGCRAAPAAGTAPSSAYVRHRRYVGDGTCSSGSAKNSRRNPRATQVLPAPRSPESAITS